MLDTKVRHSKVTYKKERKEIFVFIGLNMSLNISIMEEFTVGRTFA